MHGFAANTKERGAKIGELLIVDYGLGGQTYNGVVAVAPGEFAEVMRGVWWRQWHFDRDQQLICGKRRLIDSDEEILGGNPALAGRSTNHNCRVKRDHAGR